MIVKKILTKDFYPTLVEWSKAHKFPSKYVVLNIEYLPKYVWVCSLTCNPIDGYMEPGIFYKGLPKIKKFPIYSVFVYPSENIAWLAYPMSNPTIPYKDREGGLQFLFKELEYEMLDRGIKILFTTSETERVEKALRDCNYHKGDEKVTHYQKVIWEQKAQHYKEPEQLQD